jgi:hypothetical protein
VPSHFGSLGFSIADQDAFRALIVGLATAGTEHRIDEHLADRVWTDPSGARIVVLTRDGSIEELLPCLVGEAAPVHIRDAAMRDAEVAYVSLLTEDGGDVCPLMVELEDHALLAGLGKLEEGRLRLAAFAEQLDVHADADAYYASQDDERPKMSAEHLIPVGTFTPEPRAHAMLAAEVLQAETRTNMWSGGTFHRLRLRGIAGIEFDAAIDATAVAALPEPGSILAGTFFMTGSLGLEYPADGGKTGA